MITRKEVEHIAKLAKLELSDDEISKFEKELNLILEHFHKLNKVDTNKIEPSFHPLNIKNIFRKDSARKSIEDALKIAPQKERNHFKIPPIL